MNLGNQGLYNQVGTDPEPVTGIIGIRDFVPELPRNLPKFPHPAAANGHQASNSVQPDKEACETQAASNINRSTNSPKPSKPRAGSVPYWPEKYFSHIPRNDDEWAVKRKDLGLDSDVGGFLRKLKNGNLPEPFTDVPDHRLRKLCSRGEEFRGSRKQPCGLAAVMYILLLLGSFVQDGLGGDRMVVNAALERLIPDWSNDYTNKLKRMAERMTRMLQRVYSGWGNCSVEALIYWAPALRLMFRCPERGFGDLESYLLNNIPSQKVRDAAPIKVRIQFLLVLWWPHLSCSDISNALKLPPVEKGELEFLSELGYSDPDRCKSDRRPPKRTCVQHFRPKMPGDFDDGYGNVFSTPPVSVFHVSVPGSPAWSSSASASSNPSRSEAEREPTANSDHPPRYSQEQLPWPTSHSGPIPAVSPYSGFPTSNGPGEFRGHEAVFAGSANSAIPTPNGSREFRAHHAVFAGSASYAIPTSNGSRELRGDPAVVAGPATHVLHSPHWQPSAYGIGPGSLQSSPGDGHGNGYGIHSTPTNTSVPSPSPQSHLLQDPCSRIRNNLESQRVGDGHGNEHCIPPPSKIVAQNPAPQSLVLIELPGDLWVGDGAVDEYRVHPSPSSCRPNPCPRPLVLEELPWPTLDSPATLPIIQDRSLSYSSFEPVPQAMVEPIQERPLGQQMHLNQNWSPVGSQQAATSLPSDLVVPAEVAATTLPSSLVAPAEEAATSLPSLVAPAEEPQGLDSTLLAYDAPIDEDVARFNNSSIHQHFVGNDEALPPSQYMAAQGEMEYGWAT